MTYSMNYLDMLRKKQASVESGAKLIQVPLNSDAMRSCNVSPTLNTNSKPTQHNKDTLLPVPIGFLAKEKFEVNTIESGFTSSTIPARRWLINDYLLSGYINLLIAPGAVGKSMFTIAEAISVAIGDDLLELGKTEQGNVLIINNEDDDDELKRRIAAVCKRYRVAHELLTERLFFRSGYGKRVAFAHEEDHIVTSSTEVESLITLINEKQIRLLIVDPFVSTHDSNENDNSKIDQVVQVYKEIAKKTGVAIRLVHHTKKLGSDIDVHAGDVEIARGASSLKDAARVCHTLSLLSKKFAETNDIDLKTRSRLFRLDDAKSNFSLNGLTAKFYFKESICIENGEWLGVPRRYEFDIKKPDSLELKEKAKAKAIHAIGEAALSKLGEEGGSIPCSEMIGEYMHLTGYKSSQSNTNFTLLPQGSSRSELIHIKGNKYRIHQTKDAKRTAPRYVHIMPEV